MAIRIAIDHANGVIQKVDLRAERYSAASEEGSARDMAEFQALPADASLSRVLTFQFSPNDTVQRECRERLAHWPHLDDEIIALLDGASGRDGADWVARYIADGLTSPSPKSAPAFGRYLDRCLERWRTHLLYGKDYAAKWEPDLIPYIRGAKRIQQAGGDLRPQLKPWHDLLIKIPGLRAMAREISRF